MSPWPQESKFTGSKKRADDTLMVIVFIFLGFGLVMLYSTSAYNGMVKFDDPAYYLKKQLFATVLGIGIMYIVSKIDYHYWGKMALAAYVISMILSALVLAIGDSYNGSKRWLSLGPLSFQPAEFAKVAVILFLAKVISTRKKQLKSIVSLCKVMILVLPIVGLVGTNNLSTAIIILGIAVTLIFVASPAYKQFVILGAIGIGFVGIFLSIEQYRLERLMIWKNPEAYEKGYQTIQGLFAIGSGGVFGTGIGESLQKLGFVPEAQNDMIFSIICEEMGLVGAGIVLGLFGCMIWRFFIISHRCTDLFGALIAAGILAHISIQVLLNVAVVTNTIPNTGITLPFISYGGTSVLFLLAEMGLALSVSRYGRTHVTREEKDG